MTQAEIISIGSELISGQSLDTNSRWLSQKLAEIGVAVRWHTTVGDDLEQNVQVFRAAVERADLVLATGGLGPTQDDLTREALARLAGVDLVFDASSFEQIQECFVRRGRVMPERNRVQAMFPRGAEPLPNQWGTAPGVRLRVGECEIMALPGVPSEMYAMYEAHVRPRLLHRGLAGGVIVQRKINCFGAGESVVEDKLLDLTRRGAIPEVGITVSDGVVSLRILARASTIEAARLQIEPVEQIIRERLGELVFGTENEELEDAVVGLLRARSLKLAAAEGITAGAVAERLGRVAGASTCFVGGVVAYDDRIKTSLLGVSRELIAEKGTLSAEAAEAMAIGCRTLFGSDLAISTVGVAGPGPVHAAKPVGTVHVGLAWQNGRASHSFSWLGTRSEIQTRTAKLALNRTRLWLLQRGLGSAS